MRVLIAYNNPDQGKLALRELEKEFGKVEAFEILSQEDLDKALENFLFDVVITDYRLKWGTAFDVLRAVRKVSPHAPVILLTLPEDEEFAAEAIESGFDDYVLKSPHHIRRLPLAVKNAIDKRQREKETIEAYRRLKESEESYRTLFENAIAGIYRSTPDGKIILINPYLAKLLGYDSVEDIKKRDLNKVEFFCPGYEREKFIREIEEKGYYLGESCWIRKDGSKVWVLENAIAIRDENGKTKYYDGVAVDITKLKEAEEKLKESEELFRTLAEKSLVGIYLIQDGVFKYVNPMLAELWGYSVEELIGQSPLKFIHPEDRETVRRNLERRIKGEVDSIRYTLRMVRKDGEVRLNEVFGSRVVYKGKPAVIGTLLDITEREELIQKLKESERKYRELWENANDFLYVHDLEGRFTAVNRAAMKRFGYSPEDLMKIKVWDLLVGDSLNLVREKMEKALKGEPIEEPFEVLCKTKDGRLLWLEVRARPIYEDGKIVGFQGIARDITKRKEYEEEIKRLNLFLRIVNDVSELLVREKNTEDLVKAIVEKLSEFYPYVFVGVMKNGEIAFYPETIEDLACAKEAVSTGKIINLTPDNHIKGCKHLHTYGSLYALAIPMLYDENVTGVIIIHSDRPFSEDEVEILTTLSADVAFAINAIQLEEEKFLAYEQIERNIEQFAILVDHIRNPLAAIQLITEMEVGDERTRDKIIQQVRRIEKLIRDLDRGWIESEAIRDFLRRS